MVGAFPSLDGSERDTKRNPPGVEEPPQFLGTIAAKMQCVSQNKGMPERANFDVFLLALNQPQQGCHQ